jgi:nucleoside-diphosphate-sugar epimerase
VHGAAITPTAEVERSIPQRIMNVNLMGTVSMLEVARKVSAERFVVMSSSGVYAPLKDRDHSISEDSPVETQGLYAICKYGSELVSRQYKSLFGLSTVTGRMDSIYGPMERTTASRSRPSIIYILIRACLTQSPVRARGWALTRSFTHAEDAGAIWRHLTLAADLDHDVYNVSAGVAYTLSNVLETLHSLEPTFSYCHADSDQSADVEITADGERGAPDITRARAEFGFTPKYDLRHGLDSYLAWARDHPALFQYES